MDVNRRGDAQHAAKHTRKMITEIVFVITFFYRHFLFPWLIVLFFLYTYIWKRAHLKNEFRRKYDPCTGAVLGTICAFLWFFY